MDAKKKMVALTFDDGPSETTTHEVLDIEELDEAITEKLITEEQKQDALNKLNELLKLVENKQFPPMKEL